MLGDTTVSEGLNLSAGSLSDREGIGTFGNDRLSPGFVQTSSGLLHLCDSQCINSASLDVVLRDTIKGVGLRPILVYPSLATTQALLSVGWFRSFKRIKSTIKNAGFGLISTRLFRKGDPIGVYSGTCVPEGVSNGYIARASRSSAIFVDGTPTSIGCLDHTCLGYINDNYRHPEKNNCKLGKYNVL